MSTKITGTFKNYTDLLLAYGTIEEQADQEFLSFLKKVADQDVILTNYHPINQTFDTLFWKPDPNTGNMVMVFPNALERRYMDNVGIDKLISSSIVCTECDKHIYCKTCGLVVPKDLRYDNEPKFTYGDVYNHDCETTPTPDNISGTIITFNACEKDSAGNLTGRMWCKKHRGYGFFDEIGNSF